MADLLYKNNLYKEITSGLPEIILKNIKDPHRPNAFGYN